MLLSFTKQSDVPTATASKNLAAKLADLEAEFDGLRFYTLMDQGDYIRLIVKSVLENLFLGAALAVLHDALKEIRPLPNPIQARKRLLQRGQHVIFDAVCTRSGIAFDHKRLQALDHHAAAHLDGAGHTQLVADRPGIHIPACQDGCQRTGMRAP
ncbi:hypothetical protein SDC9_207424 [bioreactor metagenome]|uniref:Uncharacterized protein n=1 Tax=bioreactor metagenome TaxID=1076179 RepID=A0A645J9C0_9ZZZZ